MPPPPVAWVRVTLRVFSDSLDAKALARKFEAIPTTTLAEPVPGRKGDVRTSWLRELAGHSADAADPLLVQQLDFIERHRATFAGLPADAHADLYLALFASARTSFQLAPATVTRLATTGLPLVLDLYPPGSEGLLDKAPLEAPDRQWASAVLLVEGRRVRESRLDDEAPLEKHVAAIAEWLHRQGTPIGPSRLVGSYTASSGHGLAVIEPSVFAWLPQPPPALAIELVRPVGRIPARAELPEG